MYNIQCNIADSFSESCLPSLAVAKFIRMYFISVSSWLHFRLSGKVHGSLARAGKVKGQTPKVSSSSLPVRARHTEVPS